MTALEVTESLKEVVKAQSDIIYSIALEVEQSRATGSYVTDNVSKQILKAAKTLQEVGKGI